MPFVLKQGLTSVILLVLVIPVVAQEHSGGAGARGAGTLSAP